MNKHDAKRISEIGKKLTSSKINKLKEFYKFGEEQSEEREIFNILDRLN